MNESASGTELKECNESLPIVILGASAGGLEALNAFFKGAPDPIGCAYLVITHHKTDHQSMLPELLARSSGKRALEITDGMKVEPDCIYTNPSGEWFTEVKGGIFKLLTASEALKQTLPDSRQGVPSMKVYHPIDFTFQRLADEVKSRAIAVVLSGSGSDGALGLKAIKANEGMIIVQKPDSAEFTSMPENAIATGLVDSVLLPGDMGAQIQGYLHQNQESVQVQREEALASAGELRRICSLLLARTGNDFSCYKPNTMRRRVAKRMALHNFQKTSDYVEYLTHDEEEVTFLFRDMLIRVTRFFRDPELWDYLRKTLFPKLLRQPDYSDGLRIWVPACATGDEAYSIAILLNEILRESGESKKIQIFASDLDADAIAIARRGRYPAGIINEVPESLLNRYFSYSDDHYTICKSIREQIVFAPHNLIKDPPFTQIDLISCRNLLIYLKPDMQADLLSMFHMALRENGTLVLGPSESVGEASEAFETVNGTWRVFKRNPDILLERDSMKHFNSMGRRGLFPRFSQARMQPSPTDDSDLTQSVLKLLARKFAPGAILASERGDIFYLHGKAGSFLEPQEGRPHYNIFEMGRGSLTQELPVLMRLAGSSKGKRVEKTLKVEPSDDREVLVGVEKLQAPESMRGLFLIIFRDSELQTVSATGPKETQSNGNESPQVSHVFELERDLEQSRAAYQALLQEVETQNEELRSANEELQSTNEELQSSNEELETAKEETHSLYEELSSINTELVEKVNNLSEANDDMANLLNSTAMAILYLDNELRLKRFTDKAKDVIAVRESDEGRPISELAVYLADEDLIGDAQSVLATLKAIEKEVKTQDGHWYLMKLRPYRTRENVIDGLICTFVDINEVKGIQRSE
ncbi:hypothetical protein BKP64_05990 [Marinobacter salinus]|uniref:protein-glutamate O-methyltransferase n=1 Tax=Marinobacter salinus TaxID=1874317 RepID=A0A1D9GJE2_9GAMM|nr:CheR family methyltransferase [Marinobacter salinus]AOY87758.1 hypothetical protein BKP64_05990 [Marinobacter salinus]